MQSRPNVRSKKIVHHRPERVDSLNGDELESAQLSALDEILEELAGDEVTSQKLCEVL